MKVTVSTLPTVLAVDDMQMNLRIAKVFLDKRFNVIPAKSGMEALDILSRKKVDIVLLDLDMPVISGMEVLKKMREKNETKKIPVICVTAMESTPELITQVILEGAQDFISKPFDQNTLMSKVRKVLNIENHLTL